MSTDSSNQHWFHRSADEIAQHPEVDYVVLDPHWTLREVVLISGKRIRLQETSQG